MTGVSATLFGVIGLLVLGAAGSAALAQASRALPTKVDLFFNLNVEVRSQGLDADLQVSSRLEMTVSDAQTRSPKLVLSRELEPAMKFYFVDPAGPFGEEVKAAAVVSLEEGSWQALELARADVMARAEALHAEWRQQGRIDRDLDGAFAFVVIGPAAGRFVVELDASGQLSRVDNRLTDRWLTGPFEAQLGAWREDSDVSGYWFWNDGEEQPFSYEPHVYHALVEALELLRFRQPEAGATEPWDGFSEQLLKVLKTLAPKAERAMAPPLTTVFTRRNVDETKARGESTDGRLTLSRSRSQWLEDELSLRWQTKGLEVRLSVGFSPSDEAQ